MVQWLGISQVAQSLSRIIPYPAYPAPTHDPDSWCSRHAHSTHGSIGPWRWRKLLKNAGYCRMLQLGFTDFGQTWRDRPPTGLGSGSIGVPSVSHLRSRAPRAFTTLQMPGPPQVPAKSRPCHGRFAPKWSKMTIQMPLGQLQGLGKLVVRACLRSQRIHTGSIQIQSNNGSTNNNNNNNNK